MTDVFTSLGCFIRLTEGSEHILFREKFCDWPEQGRIIKMKGHDPKKVNVKMFIYVGIVGG